MAKRGVNKVILIGNLGQDPEFRELQSGSSMATISVATSDTWKDKETQEQRERTEWHRVSIFGPSANFIRDYTQKGTQVYVEGELRTTKTQGEDGKDNFFTSVVVQGFGSTIQILSNGKQSGNSSGQNASPKDSATKQEPQQSQPQTSTPPQDFDDDIPF